MTNIRYEYFTGNAISTDFFDLFAGKKLGEGISRVVYAHKQDESLVIKIDCAAGRFQNVMEWQTWGEASELKAIARWFAPCVAISPCGTVMIQKRADDVRAADMPKRVPEFFTDLKAENWGRIGGRIVCRDYGISLALGRGLTTRLRNAEWGG